MSKGLCDFMVGRFKWQVTTQENLVGGRKFCSSKNKMVLGCHVILQGHMNKWSYDFMETSPSS